MPILFNTDIALIQHPIRLHSNKDLAEITDLAQDRKIIMLEGISITDRESCRVTD